MPVRSYVTLDSRHAWRPFIPGVSTRSIWSVLSTLRITKKCQFLKLYLLISPSVRFHSCGWLLTKDHSDTKGKKNQKVRDFLSFSLYLFFYHPIFFVLILQRGVGGALESADHRRRHTYFFFTLLFTRHYHTRGTDDGRSIFYGAGLQDMGFLFSFIIQRLERFFYFMFNLPSCGNGGGRLIEKGREFFRLG
ncbi:hypothetical protein GGS20DRAFT_219201 [Poronia punctata]|nr:hypothetical protein GGS20DRAFT_219201 [Poronia punctata]